jgi:hypothetical protein
MGELLRTFTYPRNAFGRSIEESAAKALAMLTRVETRSLLRNPSDPTRFKDEPFNDMRNLHAIVSGPPADPVITDVGTRFREMARTSPTAAWRWLVTRSLWLYYVPNGTDSHVNAPARASGIRFNFFDMVVRLAVHLSALPKPQNVLYFDEFLAVLDDDQNWALTSEDLHDRVLSKRAELAIGDDGRHAALLGESNLEGNYNVGRDNLNTIFAKAFTQTGLFAFGMADRTVLGMHLDTGTYADPVLGRRLRFVLDNPRPFVE